jgi:hypothetical protein
MIPVSLYGIDSQMCERFYVELSGLVHGSDDDSNYSNALFSIEADSLMQNIEVAERWAGREIIEWSEEIAIEIEMSIRAANYPEVSMLEHLLTLENMDAVRISQWLHFYSRIYPIYSEDACKTLTNMGLDTPFKPYDMASYGLYVTRLEGLKIHSPYWGLPEIGLPRTRLLQLGLERFN